MLVKSLSSKQFEARDINRLLGIDKNKLFFWIRTHRLLKPEIHEASGTGTRSKFSIKNLLELELIKEMLDFGLDLRYIKKVKNWFDGTNVIVKNVDGNLISADLDDSEKKDVTLEKYSYYDWAFYGTYAIGIKIYRDEDDDDYVLENWEWTKDTPSKNYEAEILKLTSILTINISAIAKKLIEKIQKE